MRICCPTCQKRLEDVPQDFPFRPFCSKRCKLADLDNWLSEAYRISEPVLRDEHESVKDSSSQRLH